jgi:hypothetical protein
MSDYLATALVLALAATIAFAIMGSRLPRPIRTLLVVGLALRIAGSQVYYYLTEWVYGFGDYSTYYQVGWAWAEAVRSGTVDAFYNPYVQSWCCTGFTIRASGALMLVLGRDVHAAFMIFAMAGYAGLVALAVAFARAYPSVPVTRYLPWLVFFPSLWYWPSALGKDALMLCGLGVAVLGYVGRAGRVGWLPLGLGLGLVFMVRPQVAALVVAAMAAAFWVASDAPWSPSRVVQAVGLAGTALVLGGLAGNALGVQMFDMEEVGTYLDTRGSMSAYGGSAVETASGVPGVAMGVVNVLFRPFPFEVRGFVSLFSSLELMALWVIAFLKRRDIAAFFRGHRRSRMLWFGIIFSGAYVVLTGLSLGNLGLIARQRVHIFPFLFMLLAGRVAVSPPARFAREPAGPPHQRSGRSVA